MMKTALVSAVVLLAAAGGAVAAEVAPNVFESPVLPTPAGELDRLVFDKLSSLDLQPVLCSDAVFVRRVFLDVIGTLPTADEARAFIQDPDTENKRRALIDRLLERSEFADYWAMKWGDILRIKAEFPVNLWPNAAQAYHRWVRASIAENKPYDKFVREMLTSSGSNFRVGPVNFYRAVQSKTPETVANAVALTFLGSRIDAWPEDRRNGLAVFFSQIGYKPTSEWKEEFVFWDPLGATAAPGNTVPGRAAISTSGKPASEAAPAETPPAATEPPADNKPLAAVFPDGTKIQLPPNRDPREVFADWLITPQNPWFTRSIVNRVWAWLLGRGIIHEPDDLRDDNPPSNPQLLAYLEKELAANHYDLKTPVPLDSELQHLSAVLHAPLQRSPSRGEFCELPVAPLGCGGVDRRRQQDHRHVGPVHQPDPGAVYQHPAGQAGHCDCRRQHHQSLSGLVRPIGAGHRHGERTRQQAGPRPIAAHVEFEPYPTEARTKSQAQGDFRVRPETPRNGRGAVPDRPFSPADGRRHQDRPGVQRSGYGEPIGEPVRKARQIRLGEKA
jgi:hypothetical protein